METKDRTRVAVIDDERSLRELLEISLTREGYAVRCAADGHQALTLVEAWAPHAIVLDVMLPLIDGFSLLKPLRERTNAPIIMLSARTEVEDKVTGLRGGADDYLAKPFSLAELIARIEAAMRRWDERDAKLEFADLSVDLRTRDVRRGERAIELTRREFELLVVLMRDPRRVYSKDRLLDLVWGADYEGQIGIVETYVSYLRAKIDSGEGAKLIHTIRGAGYSLRAESV